MQNRPPHFLSSQRFGEKIVSAMFDNALPQSVAAGRRGEDDARARSAARKLSDSVFPPHAGQIAIEDNRGEGGAGRQRGFRLCNAAAEFDLPWLALDGGAEPIAFFSAG